jgi:hypothetical protein
MECAYVSKVRIVTQSILFINNFFLLYILLSEIIYNTISSIVYKP